MKAILIIVAVILVVYLTSQVSTMYKVKGDLENRVEFRLDFVDESSMDMVKRDLVADAKKLGIDLVPEHIDIEYKDTDVQSYAQKVVARKLDTQYKNKQVGINAEYDAHLLGFPIHQTVTASKVKQVAAPVLPPSKAVQELLDAP